MNNFSSCTVNLNDFVVADTALCIALDDTFFAGFENSEVLGGRVDVVIKLHKTDVWQALHITLKGTARVACDRCLDEFDQAIQYTGDVRIGNTQSVDLQENTDSEIVFVGKDDARVDLSQYLYESVCLSLPILRVHPNDSNGNSTCNPIMLEKLKELSVNDSE
ncbi:hypothetical protein FACS189452_00280 [Bacteroidia bacterium]|nr:hypothetical protein FACS189452_00280 [Bacteroidia bacterium]GHT80336.1 hypothetical protein FACS189467_2250 [Bacteroidia bacterium]